MGRRTPTGNWNGKCCWPVFAAQSPPTLPTLAYHALVPDAAGLMTPVLVGPGTVSEGRVSDILLPDYESVYKTFGTSQLGWEGGRVTYNRVLNSLDMTDFSSGTTASIIPSPEINPLGTQTFFAEYATGGTVKYSEDKIATTYANNEKYVIKALVKGTDQVRIDQRFAATGHRASIDIDLLTGTITAGQEVSAVITYSASTDMGDGWWAVVFEATSGVAAVNLIQMSFVLDAGESCFVTQFECYQDESGADVENNPPIFTPDVPGVVVYATDSGGDPLPEMPWLVHAPQSTNKFLNSHAPVTQTINALTGDHTCWLEGTGQTDLSGAATGTATDGTPVVFDAAGGNVTHTVSGGPPDFVQTENQPFPTYPIVTTSVAATRDTCALALTELHTVWNATEGTLYLETAITGDSAVLSSAGLDFLSINSSEPVLTDGTNTAVVAVANPSKIGIAYSAAGMAVNADGVWGTTVPYDGSMVGTLVELFKAGAVVQKARNIQYKDTEDRAWLDQEMAA